MNILIMTAPKEAGYWKKEKNALKCGLCIQNCLVAEGKTGFCGARKNLNGKLYSLVYGKTTGLAVDPIEKKPLFHFKPATQCISFGTFGCNFRCLHCQNFSSSQEFSEAMINALPLTSPEEIVQKTLEFGLPGIAYTYNEPTIFAEYALDTMKEAKKHGLYNVWVSNGYMGKELAKDLLSLLDAINIDLKGNAKFYKEACGNVDIEKVKENIKFFHKNKIHVEVTTLIIPGHNDSEKDFKEIAEFIASVDESIPLHFTRFYPAYKMAHLPATSQPKLFKAKELAEKIGIKYVYVGNIGGEENTACFKCGNILVKRQMYSTELTGLNKKTAKCSSCGTKHNFVL